VAADQDGLTHILQNAEASLNERHGFPGSGFETRSKTGKFLLSLNDAVSAPPHPSQTDGAFYVLFDSSLLGEDTARGEGATI
jgi:hypothetical protein